MNEEIQRAVVLLVEALPLTATNPTEATRKVAEAVRALMVLFPNQSVGPDFPEGPDSNAGGGGEE